MYYELMCYESTFERTDGVVVMTIHIMIPLVTGISQHEKPSLLNGHLLPRVYEIFVCWFRLLCVCIVNILPILILKSVIYI
jgi:hypothetical protein